MGDRLATISWGGVVPLWGWAGFPCYTM